MGVLWYAHPIFYKNMLSKISLVLVIIATVFTGVNIAKNQTASMSDLSLLFIEIALIITFAQ